MSHQSNRFPLPLTLISSSVLIAYSTSLQAAESGISQDSIVSIAIAAISGAALVTALWAMLLGRKSMKKDRDFVGTLKKNIVHDQKRIDSSLKSITASEKRAEKVVDKLVHQNNALMSKQHYAWLNAEKIQELAESSAMIEADLLQKAESLERRIEQTQHVWNERLNETENTVLRVEQELREGLNHLETGIKRVQQQDAHSYQLAQHITAQHGLQLNNLEANNALSEQVKSSLNKTLQESTALLEHLQGNQQKAEHAYQTYMESIGQYEGELYSQYDVAFQNADIACKELTANVDESRLHVESLRRYEEQSRAIKENTEQNLKQLDVKSIKQLADTLDTTQQTFQSLSQKVAEAQQALNSLNQLDLKKEAEPNSTEEAEDSTHHFREAVGDSTLVPFFASRKQKDKRH